MSYHRSLVYEAPGDKQCRAHSLRCEGRSCKKRIFKCLPNLNFATSRFLQGVWASPYDFADCSRIWPFLLLYLAPLPCSLLSDAVSLPSLSPEVATQLVHLLDNPSSLVPYSLLRTVCESLREQDDSVKGPILHQLLHGARPHLPSPAPRHRVRGRLYTCGHIKAGASSLFCSLKSSERLPAVGRNCTQPELAHDRRSLFTVLALWQILSIH